MPFDTAALKVDIIARMADALDPVPPAAELQDKSVGALAAAVGEAVFIIEGRASDPVDPAPGRLWWRTDLL